ncbi:MAG: VOC family protein [Mycobacteriales bacterium]
MDGALHHVELWVDDLAAARATLGWLLERLGWTPYRSWEHGRSWLRAETYVVVEQSPARASGGHDRMRPGLNHLAFHVADPEALAAEALTHGWSVRVRTATAVHLVDGQGFEVELTAGPAGG